MNLAQILNSYLNLNLLLLVGVLSLMALSALLKFTRQAIPSRDELKLHYWVLASLLLLTLMQPFLPNENFFSPVAKLWSAPSMKSFNHEYIQKDHSGFLSFQALHRNEILSAKNIATVGSSGVTLLILIWSSFMLRSFFALWSLKRKSFLVRRVGRVRIFVSDRVRVPFSYWLPFSANIVLPTLLIERAPESRMAIAHELQHHRHGDTRWVYVVFALKFVCFLNPAIYFWSRWISEIQEFACDETLVDQKKVESQAYARCLVEVAQTAINQEFVPVCATGLTFLTEGNLLKRRVEKMFSKSPTEIKRSIRLSFAVIVVSFMAVGAFASKGLVQDRRVSMAQAQVWQARAQSDTGFPIVLNDLVLQELNRYVGTPEGREFMRESLKRMGKYKLAISSALMKYGVPNEIMAVPIVESGYQNLPESNKAGWGAGLWMFIKQTARTYGLRVDAQIDERLDVDLLTDAAMRYLSANNLRFRDWQLALLAYNVGEAGVQKAIEKTGSRDAWTLIRKGFENDRDYLPRVMAAIIIMRNPESVN